MVEYKVFSWRIDLNTDEELENELNKYAKDGWKICNISNSSGGGSLFSSSDGNRLTFILEKI